MRMITADAVETPILGIADLYRKIGKPFTIECSDVKRALGHVFYVIPEGDDAEMILLVDHPYITNAIIDECVARYDHLYGT